MKRALCRSKLVMRGSSMTTDCLLLFILSEEFILELSRD